MGSLKELTSSELLRMANHEFLNQLHLIKMNLDLERIDEAKAIIEQYVNKSKAYSSLNRLSLPKTTEWIRIFPYRYSAIELKLKTNIIVAQNMQKDDEIVEYLEKTIQHVYGHLNPYKEQQLSLDVNSSEDGLTICFDLQGEWEIEPIQLQNFEINVQTYEETNQSWKYVLTVKE